MRKEIESAPRGRGEVQARALFFSFLGPSRPTTATSPSALLPPSLLFSVSSHPSPGLPYFLRLFSSGTLGPSIDNTSHDTENTLHSSFSSVFRFPFFSFSNEVVLVFVGVSPAAAALQPREQVVESCRSRSRSAAAAAAAASALLAAASRPLFEGEELRWPGFVEFDDVNGVVLTRSGGSCPVTGGGIGGGGGGGGENASSSPPSPPSPSSAAPSYAIHDLSDYSLRFRVDGKGVREVRTAPGLLLLVMEPRAAASSSSSSPAPPPPSAAAATSTPTTTTATPTPTPTTSAGGGGGGGVPCRLLSITDGTLLASFDAPAPPGGGGRLDFIELFGHTLLVGGGTPPTLTRVDVRTAPSSPSSSSPAVASVSPPAPFPTPSAFIFLHEARLFLAFGGEQQSGAAAAAAAAAAAGASSSSLLPSSSSSVVVCDGAGARIRSLDGAVSVGSVRSPGGPAANSVYVTADQQFIVSYSSRAAAAAAAATAVTPATATAATAAEAAAAARTAAVGAPPSPAASRRGTVAARGRCSCGAVFSSPGGTSASPSPATSSGGQQQQQQLPGRRRRHRRSTSTATSSDEEEEEEEEIGGVITVSHVLSGRCVARLAAKKMRARKTSSSKRAKMDDNDDDDSDDDFAASHKANEAVRRALSDVSALFYDEETGELVTGSADGHVHVWSNHV